MLEPETFPRDMTNGETKYEKYCVCLLTEMPNEIKSIGLLECADLHNAELSEIQDDCSQLEREPSTSFNETEWSRKANREPTTVKIQAPEDGTETLLIEDEGIDGCK